ncbi:hypothetical protein FRC12_014020 [Ceratobasidium sp. 428]|nr:hypothetical protein FRC12_014020 [Ceratobasidium sp. 428]
MSTAAKKRVRQYTSTSTKESNPGVVRVAAVRPQKKVKRAPPTQHTSVVESVSPLKTFANDLACALPVPSRVPASDFTFSCSASKSSSEETPPIVEPPESVPPLAAQSKKSGKGQNEMLTDWSSKAIKAQLINLLAHETPSNGDSICDSCRLTVPALYSCQDCFTNGSLCAQCLCARHQTEPAHRFRIWNGKSFSKIDSSSAGYVFHLGHGGRLCNMGKEQNFVLGHTNGIHTIRIRFCKHPGHASPGRQLMQARIYPCSEYQPASGFSYSLLRQFSLLASESKLSAQRYWDTLVSMTNAAHPEKVPNRYRELLRVIRQWDHLQDVKRVDSEHYGVSEDPVPDLALRCLACPNPNVNYLPDDVTPETQHLFAQHISFDGSFHLYRKKKAFDSWDICLSDGRKYFVQSKPFNAFLQEQLSRKGHKMAKDASCNNHKAADNKWVKLAGAAETGVGSAICARHSMFLSSGTVNFLSGEMFLYADYIFQLLLLHCRSEGVTDVGIHYNIICHYIIKMWERWGEIQCLGGDIKQADFESFIAAIPKFHLAGHTITCFIRFALNHIFGVGRLDAEGGERCWSNLNHASGSTSDRGPGSRIDTLNSVMQQWNWKKIIGMAAYILEKWEEARTMATEQRKAWLEFSGTFDPTDITSWESMSLEPEFKNNQWTSVFALPETEGLFTSKCCLLVVPSHMFSHVFDIQVAGVVRERRPFVK